MKKHLEVRIPAYLLPVVLVGALCSYSALSAPAFLLEQEAAIEQVNPPPATQEVQSQENPFKSGIAKIDIYVAEKLMTDFKVTSLVLFLVLMIPAVILYRRYIKKKLPKSKLVTFLLGFVAYFVVTFLINIGLYILARHYGWMGFDTLDKAVNDGELWAQFKNTWSLGLGSFYVAHFIDTIIVAALSFTATAFVAARSRW
jgi:hypothetical protein